MKTMNHDEYKKKVKRQSEAELRFTIKDATEAVQANPTGDNVGYYLDEVNYASAELRKRY